MRKKSTSKFLASLLICFLLITTINEMFTEAQSFLNHFTMLYFIIIYQIIDVLTLPIFCISTISNHQSKILKYFAQS